MTLAVYVTVVMFESVCDDVLLQVCGWEWSGIIRTEGSMMGAMKECATSPAGAHGNISGLLYVTIRSADVCACLQTPDGRLVRAAQEGQFRRGLRDGSEAAL